MPEELLAKTLDRSWYGVQCVLKKVSGNWTKEVSESHDHGRSADPSTVHWNLIRCAVIGSVAVKKPFIRKGNMQKRQRYAKLYKNWTHNQWQHVRSTADPFGNKGVVAVFPIFTLYTRFLHMFARVNKSLHRLLVFLENIKKWVLAQNLCTELYLYTSIFKGHSFMFNILHQNTGKWKFGV